VITLEFTNVNNRRYILSSCGASLISNLLGRELEEKFGKKLSDFSNYRREDLREKHYEIFQFLEEYLKGVSLMDKSEDELRRLSAELNSLILYYRRNGYPERGKEVHALLATDTYFGEIALKLLREILENRFGVSVLTDRPVPGLQTASLDDFQLALSDIAEKYSREIIYYREEGYRIIFNLTGGFKSVNNFLQVMASLYADESIYVFERTNELLTIPRLPIEMDRKIFEKHLDLFRRVELGIAGTTEIPDEIPESLLFSERTEVMLTPYGELLWQKMKMELYGNRLISPLIDRIRYSESFKRRFEKFDSDDERRQINRSIDALIRFVLTGGRENPRSCRFHTLTNHRYYAECYPFQENDSRRLYINRQGKTLILEKIDDHL